MRGRKGEERERESEKESVLPSGEREERELLYYVSLSDRGASDRTLVTASRQ